MGAVRALVGGQHRRLEAAQQLRIRGHAADQGEHEPLEGDPRPGDALEVGSHAAPSRYEVGQDGDEVGEPGVDDGEDELEPVGEVVVDAALRPPGDVGDRLGGQPADAVAPQYLLRGEHEALAGVGCGGHGGAF